MSYYLRLLETKLQWIQNGFIFGFKKSKHEFAFTAFRHTNEHCTMRKFWEVHIFDRQHLKTVHLTY